MIPSLIIPCPVQSPDSELLPLAEEYMTDNFGCVRETRTGDGKGVRCRDVPVREMELRFQQDPQESWD